MCARTLPSLRALNQNPCNFLLQHMSTLKFRIFFYTPRHSKEGEGEKRKGETTRVNDQRLKFRGHKKETVK